MKHISTRILSLLLCVIFLCGMLASCDQPGKDAEKDPGQSEQQPENPTPQQPNTPGKSEVSLSDFDPEKTYPLVNYFDLDMTEYVQLGRYKNMSVTLSAKSVTLTDAQLQNEIDAILAAHHPGARITDRPAKEGDTVVMDYVGKLDGVAFQGGTATDQTITISENNGYIPGFVDGIIGLTPGVMAEVPVTFPENYGKEELNGKAVIFEMTVKYIVGTPELDDAFVADYTEGEISTAEAFTASLRQELEDELYAAALRSAIWLKIQENSAVLSYPADAVLYYYQYYYTMYGQYAKMYGLELDTFLQYNGTTQEGLFSYCKEMVKQDLIRHAVYQDGSYSCTDEQYQAFLEEYTVANYESLRASMLAMGEKDYTFEQAKAYFDENYQNQLRDTCIDGVVTEALGANATVTVE